MVLKTQNPEEKKRPPNTKRSDFEPKTEGGKWDKRKMEENYKNPRTVFRQRRDIG